MRILDRINPLKPARANAVHPEKGVQQVAVIQHKVAKFHDGTVVPAKNLEKLVIYDENGKEITI